MIRFGWDPHAVNATLRRLLGVAIDPTSTRQGYSFSVTPGRLTIVAHGDHDYALVHVPVALASSPGRFSYPTHTLADLVRLRQPVTFEADDDGGLRYSDDAGDGFRWAPAKRRQLGPISAERGIRPLGSAPAGLLGFALTLAARFLRSLRVPAQERTVGLSFGDDIPGFVLVATSDIHALRIVAGHPDTLSPVIGVSPPRQKALAAFLHGLEDVVRASGGELRAAVRDSFGNGYAFPQVNGPRQLPALPIHVEGTASGRAASRSIAHLERDGHGLLALRVSSAAGHAQIGVRGEQGRFLGEHPWTGDGDANAVVGVDVEAPVLRALLLGVGPGNVWVRLGPSPSRPGDVALQVLETRTMHQSGRAPRAKDATSELFACTFERRTTVPAGSRGAVRAGSSTQT